MSFAALRVAPERPVRLADVDPGATPGYHSKFDGGRALAKFQQRLAERQEVLVATRERAVLLVFQGADASGKDSAIEHVMSGVNTAGVDVHSFKPPSAEELEHDFLWRCARVLPERGRIGIFNRSYYEEVVVVRVHPEMLVREGISNSPQVWQGRFDDINAFERHLTRNGTVVLKFFLHLSKDEQRKRLMRRIKDPRKHWKLLASDLDGRSYWPDYQSAYEEAINATSTACAPWYVIPADHKWFVRAAVAGIVVDALDALKLEYPALSGDATAQLERFRQQLKAE